MIQQTSATSPRLRTLLALSLPASRWSLTAGCRHWVVNTPAFTLEKLHSLSALDTVSSIRPPLPALQARISSRLSATWRCMLWRKACVGARGKWIMLGYPIGACECGLKKLAREHIDFQHVPACSGLVRLCNLGHFLEATLFV